MGCCCEVGLCGGVLHWWVFPGFGTSLFSLGAGCYTWLEICGTLDLGFVLVVCFWVGLRCVIGMFDWQVAFGGFWDLVGFLW